MVVCYIKKGLNGMLLFYGTYQQTALKELSSEEHGSNHISNCSSLEIGHSDSPVNIPIASGTQPLPPPMQ